MSWLETVAPQWALKRARARASLEVAKRVQDGNLAKRGYVAATTGRRLASWQVGDGAPPGHSHESVQILRERSRDLRRNNPYVQRFVQGLGANVVGTGITNQIQRRQGVSFTSASDAESAWQAWADSTACDFDGRHNFYGLQGVAFRSTVESDEVLIRRHIGRRSINQPIPLQLQILEIDMLADHAVPDASTTGRQIRGGIEFDAKGRRVAYHLFKEHPATPQASTETVRIPAEEIIHLYRVDRPGQIRGVPWAAPVMPRLKLLDSYEDAALERARVSACFSAFVTDPDGPPEVTSAEEDLPFKVEPGMIEILGPGKEVTFGTPPSNADYSDFVRANLRAVAAGLGVPYELLSGDLSQVNFSSGRMGFLEFNRNIDEWRWQLLIPLFCDRVFSWWKDVARLRFDTTDCVASWTAPRREMIDPTREVPAIIKRVRAGLCSLPEAIREDGYQPDQVLAEIAEFNAKIDERDLTLDSDPRKISQAGQVQIINPANEVTTSE